MRGVAAGAGQSRRGGGEGEKVDCVSGHRGKGGAEYGKAGAKRSGAMGG